MSNNNPVKDGHDIDRTKLVCRVCGQTMRELSLYFHNYRRPKPCKQKKEVKV